MRVVLGEAIGLVVCDGSKRFILLEGLIPPLELDLPFDSDGENIHADL